MVKACCAECGKEVATIRCPVCKRLYCANCYPQDHKDGEPCACEDCIVLSYYAAQEEEWGYDHGEYDECDNCEMNYGGACASDYWSLCDNAKVGPLIRRIG
jgi:hypothetical protein